LIVAKRAKKEKMLHVAVYFTKSEFKEIRKKAGKDVLKISPYLRQHCVQSLNLNGKA